MEYHNILKKEDVHTEYKEFFLHYNNTLNGFIKRLFKTKKMNDDYINIIDANIRLYFQKYFMKYYVLFNNTNQDGGKLYIGITDDGIIKGVPHRYLGEEYIRKIISEDICLRDLNEYIKKTKIEVIKITPKNDTVNMNQIKQYIKFINNKMIIELSAYLKHIENINNLKKKINLYRSKFYDVFKSSYLRNKCKIFIKNKCRVTKYRKQLYKDIMFPPIDITPDNIRKYKNDKKNIIHYVAEFRDMYTSYYASILKRTKINIDFKLLNKDPYINIFRNANMTYELLKEHNNDVNLYVICIHFPRNVDSGIIKINDKIPYRSVNKENEPITIFLNQTSSS